MDGFDFDFNANHFPDAPPLNLNTVTPYFNPANSASPTNRSENIDEDTILSLMISNGIMDYPSDMFYPDLTEQPVAASTQATLSPTFSTSLAPSPAPECALHPPPFTESAKSVDNPIQNIAPFSSMITLRNLLIAIPPLLDHIIVLPPLFQTLGSPLSTLPEE
ncbi:uncharacterized protein ARMOST_00560 [Armillaria ostoyae]|uniref:Uncharacterized protein n=1 Tax=Armillaria ostoyae TaxID=47428 RepID=A0A284QLI1_ARMOS|nr:uncharacterized protein ARMOST_00560 [Armillaria ostoyae]